MQTSGEKWNKLRIPNVMDKSPPRHTTIVGLVTLPFPLMEVDFHDCINHIMIIYTCQLLLYKGHLHGFKVHQMRLVS